MFLSSRIMGPGISKVISTSKIRNTRAIRKKWSENGSRARLFGSNPHSKADEASRDVIDFSPIVEFNTISNIATPALIININEISLWALCKRLFNWKLNLLFIILKEYKDFRRPISICLYIKIVTLHLRNVNIMLPLQIQSDELS